MQYYSVQYAVGAPLRFAQVRSSAALLHTVLLFFLHLLQCLLVVGIHSA
jgi:hypothetical protein